MRRVALVITALAVGAMALPAQTPRWFTPEVRPFVGAYVPTGTQRDLFKDAAMFGVQAAVEIRPTFHVLGSFAWVPAQNRYDVANNDVNVFQYDAGVEFDLVRPVGENWQFKPFLGLGAGGRTYAYKDDALSDKTCLSGYGAVGSEFQIGRTALRLEARDNVFCYRSPVPGGGSKTRNDVGLAAGLAYHFR